MFNIGGHGKPYPSTPPQDTNFSSLSPQAKRAPNFSGQYGQQQVSHQHQQQQSPNRQDVEVMMRAGGRALSPLSSTSVTDSRRGQANPNDFGSNPWLNQPGAGAGGAGAGAGSRQAGGMGTMGSGGQHMSINPQQQQQQQTPGQDGQTANKKKKRRTDGESPSVDEKRTKTGRACDACRSKKIRCDILPSDVATGTDKPPICAHCKQYNIECTFFLPITETRFKKRRPQADDASGAGSPSTQKPIDGVNGAATTKVDKPSAGSIPFLLSANVPTRQFEQYDITNHSHWEVSEDDDGQIVVEATPLDSGDDHATRLDKYVLPGPVMSALVNKYFEYDNMFLPVISRDEFLASPKPNPFLLYCMCASASVGREYPRHVFQRLRGLVNGLIRCNEILSHAKLEHVQALLIISPTGEIHAQPYAPTASAASLRVACAVRMAQDLLYYREPKAQPSTAAEAAAMETKRRIWAVCVFLDRWIQNSLGLPQMIDIEDCDVLIPSPRQVVPGLEPAQWPVNQGYLCLIENLKLSLIVGRILKIMYGPTGMTRTTDEQLETLLAEMSAWRAGIPGSLQFKGTDSPFLAGYLHIMFTATQYLFWRGFIRVTRPPPPHLKLMLDTNHWADLVQWSRGAIEWLNVHDRTLDTLFLFPYSATSCALIQYHTWARRKDGAALETLKLIRNCVQRWEAAVQPDQMSIRRKSCETMTLLYEAALKTIGDPDDRTDRSEGTPSSAHSGGSASASAAGATSVHDPHLQPAFPPRKIQLTDVANNEGEGPMFVEYDHSPALRAPPSDEGAPTAIDISFLDSIPESNFDWSGWGQYFETVDRMFPSAPGEAEADMDK